MSKKAKLQTVVPGWADNSLLFLAVSATYVAIWAVDNDPATAADRWPLIHKIFVDRIIFYRVFNPETIVPFSITVITVCIYTVVSVAVAIWSYFRLRRQGALSFDFEDRKQRRALLLGLPFVALAVFFALLPVRVFGMLLKKNKTAQDQKSETSDCVFCCMSLDNNKTNKERQL